jgi:predicted DNA-binding ArsR family transcriptional regulator
MGWIMGTPADFCQNAHDCLDLARHCRNEVHRKLLLDLATKWFELAGMTRREIELLKDTGKQSAA